MFVADRPTTLSPYFISLYLSRLTILQTVLDHNFRLPRSKFTSGILIDAIICLSGICKLPISSRWNQVTLVFFLNSLQCQNRIAKCYVKSQICFFQQDCKQTESLIFPIKSLKPSEEKKIWNSNFTADCTFVFIYLDFASVSLVDII